jgi:HSP20 family molecular chaperone IbpA
VPKDKLSLHVEADTLTIEGEVALNLPEGMEPSHAEVALPRYRRVFTLSKELDSGKVEAELNQGVLKLRIPKAEHAQPRKIEVKVA